MTDDSPGDSSISNQELLEEITRLHDRIDTLESKLSESDRSGSKSNLKESIWQDGRPATEEAAKVVKKAKDQGQVKTSEVAEIVGVTDKPARKRMKILGEHHPKLKYVDSRPRGKANLLVFQG